MRARFPLVPLVLFAIPCSVLVSGIERHSPALVAGELPAPEYTRLEVSGLEQPVEILKDLWGISHIYAETEHDLFFGQGYSAVRDRLFQFEVWRRQATGTVAEILGGP